MQKYHFLKKWLVDNGALLNKIDLVHVNEDFRKITSTKTIDNNETVLFIPRNLLITHLDTVQYSPICQKLYPQIQCEHTLLSIFLLEEKEKGNKSKWFNYISCLPQNYDSMSMFFDNNTLDLIKNTLSFKKILEKRKILAEIYETICSIDSSFKKFTLNDFLWARTVVITRIFGLSIDDKEVSCLVPFADMLNHKNPDKISTKTETSWFFDENNNGFIIKSNRKIKENREIFDSYGFKSNIRFFVNYGFIVCDNEDDDETFIHIEELNEDFEVPSFYRNTRLDEPKTKDLLEKIRNYISPAHSLDNEEKVISILYKNVIKQINKYSFPIEEYLEKSEKEKIYKIQTSYLICYLELNILHKFRKFCEIILDILKNQKIKKIYKKGKQLLIGNIIVDEYVKDILIPILK